MTFISVLNGRGDGAEEEALEMPDDLEVTDHKHHVLRCAVRYKLLRRQGRRVSRKVDYVLLVLGGIALWSVATSGPLAPVFAKILP